MPKPEPPVIDTVVLRVMAFAHPDGLDILLSALGASRARFPAEVYNQDEDALSLNARNETLSELARGLRYARRQVEAMLSAQAERYRTWLDNSKQLPRHLERGVFLSTRWKRASCLSVKRSCEHSGSTWVKQRVWYWQLAHKHPRCS